MEALSEPPRLFVLAREEQFARPFRLNLADVLDVNLFVHNSNATVCYNLAYIWMPYLRRLERQLHLHLTAPCAQPQEDLLAIVQNHDIIIGQIILAKVGALFGYCKVALFVRAPEQPRVVHVVGVSVVRLATAQRHPEEVLGLFAFVEDLCGCEQNIIRYYNSY